MSADGAVDWVRGARTPITIRVTAVTVTDYCAQLAQNPTVKTCGYRLRNVGLRLSTNAFIPSF